ncbi:hypothetical protein LSH36_291g09026 [Paralvinella palmiformis]|uniref:Fucosyltransferase n=1 Tax=Paralvinella palmiformis TaxID=53620 RepID=A0AAD9JJ34_9ANNE|nr:hypothetical protein LSH36_291g09026 [Paralvinella palmiformis]
MIKLRYHTKLIVLSAVVVGLIYVIQLSRSSTHPSKIKYKKNANCNPSHNQTNFSDTINTNITTLKTILFWTPYFDSETWDFETLGRAPFEHQLCRHRCMATTDRTKVTSVEAVLFHFADVDVDNWPAKLPEDVIKVLVVHEPPPVTGKWMFGFDGRVHYVMSYRRDSDFYSPYRVIRPLTAQDPPRYVPRVPLSARNKSVVWVVSRCKTGSHREQYVEELAKHIDIDVYGQCGSHSCPKEQWHLCLERFASNYKFYLSFENSLCRDYISEKFFEPLRHDIIPVVLGERDSVLSEHLTPEAYINARNFDSPKTLAAYLRRVASDEKLFNKYFEWKPKYEILSTHGPLTSGFCQLCDWLNARDNHVMCNYRSDVSKWWYDGVCDNDFVLRQLKKIR